MPDFTSTDRPSDDLILNYHLMHPGGESAPGDPNAAFYLDGDAYYAISGGRQQPLMKSNDLKQWTLVGDFLRHELPDVAIGEDISCPNFFELDGKLVLVCISHPLGCRYYIGDWDAEAEQ